MELLFSCFLSIKKEYQRKENPYNDAQLQRRLRNCSLLDTPNYWISFLISQVCSYCYLLLLSQNRAFGKKSSPTSGFYRWDRDCVTTSFSTHLKVPSQLQFKVWTNRRAESLLQILNSKYSNGQQQVSMLVLFLWHPPMQQALRFFCLFTYKRLSPHCSLDLCLLCSVVPWFLKPPPYGKSQKHTV